MTKKLFVRFSLPEDEENVFSFYNENQHAFVFKRDPEVNVVFFVTQKQVLGVPARNLAAQGPRLLNSEQRRVLHRRMRDSQAVEHGEELIGCFRHGAINPDVDGLVLSKNREGKRQCGFY